MSYEHLKANHDKMEERQRLRDFYTGLGKLSADELEDLIQFSKDMFLKYNADHWDKSVHLLEGEKYLRLAKLRPTAPND